MKALAVSFVTGLRTGDILWVSRPDIANGDPHPHLIVGIDDEFIHTVCGTTKKETTERVARFRKQGDLAFYPCFGPGGSTGLSDPTYFDCTISYPIRKALIIQEKTSHPKRWGNSGRISFGDYEQVRSALMKSPTIDIKDLLVHEED